tara:strand:+ start:11213 stop:11359 length:147 start_codon:yes stop_codon:yes gene_type:complete
MTSIRDLEYIYQYVDSPQDFQRIVEDITNQLIRYHNDENQEVVAWFLA